MEKTFESQMEELEKIVAELEKGDLNLDKSVEKFEEGIKISKERNCISNTSNAETFIHADDSSVKVFVIPTDEELVMTEDAYALMKGTYDVHTNFTYSFQSKDYVNKAREESLKNDIQKHPELESILARNLIK